MSVVPGAPVTPESLRVLTMDELTLAPTPSSGSRVVVFNHGYGIYVDNVGIATPATSRMWIDTPTEGDVVIGPRSGASLISTMRLRTGRTTGNAANMNLDGSTYTVSRNTSSLRYKQDVEDYQFDLDALRDVRIVSFRDRNQVAEWEGARERIEAGAPHPGDTEVREPRRYLGVIAEEIHDAGLTGAVDYDAQGRPDWVMYDRLTLGLFQLVRDQEQRITALEARLAALEAGSNSPDPVPDGGDG